MRHPLFLWYPILSPVTFALVVLVLGFVTPGYDHGVRTISELSIGRYGWIQQANFLQLALCFVVLSFRISDLLHNARTKKIWSNTFRFCALMLVAVTVFPTSSLEELRASLSSFSTGSFVHWLALATFFIASPFGIHALASSIQVEPAYRHIATITRTCGYSCVALVVIWLLMFYGDVQFSYFGLHQKLIAAICLYWLERCASAFRR